MRKPSPCQRRIAALTLAPPRIDLLRDGGGDLGEEVVELGRRGGCRLPTAATARLGRAAAGLASVVRRSASPSLRRPASRACAGVSGVSLTAWNAMSRLSAPSSSRTLSMPSAATRLEHALAERGAALLRLAAQDRDAGLVVGRRDVDDEPAGEAADQALVERLDLGGRPVAGEDDLPVGRLERVGEPQQLRLHLAPVGEELHVVHQQQVDVEEALAVRLALPGRDRGVERLDELVEREVLDGEPRVDRPGRVADRPSAGASCRARAGRR